MNRHRDPETSCLLEAALCAWEWMLQNHLDPLIAELWDGIGSSAMRMCSMQAGEIALTTWNLMESKGIEFHSCYDWEFVPAVMVRLDWPKLIEHNQYGGEPYQPDLEVILADIMKGNDDFETPEQRWVTHAVQQARKQWAYPDLVADHDDKHDFAEDPAAWVKRIGEKYDLTPVENFK